MSELLMRDCASASGYRLLHAPRASGYRLLHAPPDTGLGAPVRPFADTFSGVQCVREKFFPRESGFRDPRDRPPVTTSTMPPERRRFVWYRHKMAAENMLADILGDVPRLTPIHEANQLRGLTYRDLGVWVEVIGHDYTIPDAIAFQVKLSGLLVMGLHDRWVREKRIAEIKDAAREFRTCLTDIAPDDLL